MEGVLREARFNDDREDNREAQVAGLERCNLQKATDAGHRARSGSTRSCSTSTTVRPRWRWPLRSGGCLRLRVLVLEPHAGEPALPSRDCPRPPRHGSGVRGALGLRRRQGSCGGAGDRRGLQGQRAPLVPLRPEDRAPHNSLAGGGAPRRRRRPAIPQVKFSGCSACGFGTPPV